MPIQRYCNTPWVKTEVLCGLLPGIRSKRGPYPLVKLSSKTRAGCTIFCRCLLSPRLLKRNLLPALRAYPGKFWDRFTNPPGNA